MNIINEIKKSTSNLYLFYGEDEFLKSFYVDKLKTRFVSSDLEMNCSVADANNLIDMSCTLPFYNDYRVVIVKNSEMFCLNKKLSDESFLKMLTLKQIPSSSIIIFSEIKVDKRSKLFKKVSELGSIFEVKTPTQKELTKWIIRTAESNCKQISFVNADLLTKLIPNDMYTMKSEMEKLFAYCSDKNEITYQDIDLICSKSLEARVFDLVDAIGNKKTREAMNIYQNLIAINEAPLMILTMISRQIMLILQAKILSGLNKTNLMSIPSFVLRNCLHQSLNYTEQNLIDILERCLEFDFKIKTGQINDRLAIELIILGN